MNTVKSFWIGWGSLCVAGAGAYYFAKQEINRDRRAKLEAQRQQKSAQHALQQQYSAAEASASSSLSESGTGTGSGSGNNGGPARTDTVGSPSQEAGSDPASTRHAPATEGQQVFEKSKYESSTPFRSRKGDRFN